MSVSVKRSRCHQGRLLCEFRRGAWPIWHIAMLPTTIGRPQPNWRVQLCCLPSHLTHWQTRKPSLWGTTMSLWAGESGSLEGNKRGGKTSIYFFIARHVTNPSIYNLKFHNAIRNWEGNNTFSIHLWLCISSSLQLILRFLPLSLSC